jgi:ankyrin repeat protein
MSSDQTSRGHNFEGLSADGNARQHNGDINAQVYNSEWMPRALVQAMLLQTLNNQLLSWLDHASYQRQTSFFLNRSQDERDKWLLEAATDGQVRRLELLIHADGYLDHQDKDGRTALHKAVLGNYQDCVELLLDYGANVNTIDKAEKTAFYLAAEKGNSSMVAYLVRKRANIKLSSISGSTLHAAAKSGNVTIVELLVTLGLHIEEKTRDTGRTPLTVAARWGRLAVIEFLINRGAQIEAKAIQGYTALMIACQHGHTAVIEALLNRGAQIEAKLTSGHTALMTACRYGHTAVIEALLNRGAEIEAKSTSGHTALMIASQYEHTAAIEVLLSRGAQIEAKLTDGYTALMIACQCGHTETIEVLLNRGAQIEAKLTSGYTALMITCQYGHTAAMEVLLNRGARIEAKLASGHTALMIACQYEHTAAIEALLNRGAQIEAKSTSGHTALTISSGMAVTGRPGHIPDDRDRYHDRQLTYPRPDLTEGVGHAIPGHPFAKNLFWKF